MIVSVHHCADQRIAGTTALKLLCFKAASPAKSSRTLPSTHINSHVRAYVHLRAHVCGLVCMYV